MPRTLDMFDRSRDADPFDSSRPEALIPFRPAGTPSWFPAAGGPGLPADPACRRCEAHKGAHSVCMASEGPEGAPLLVLPTPAQKDDVAGRLVETGETGLCLSEARRWSRDVRATWAARCASGRAIDEVVVEACRPYLAAEMRRAPRAVLFGPVAALGALGVPFSAARTRKAWATWDDPETGRSVPCLLVAHPSQGAARNRFHRRMFDADVQWAMTSEPVARPEGTVRVLLSAGEAIAWLEAATRDPIAVDAEYWPNKGLWRPDFRVLCLGLCQDPAAPVVIPEELLRDPGVVAALKRVMEDPSYPKVNQNLKVEVHVLWRLGIDLVGVEWDCLIASRLRDSDGPAALAKTSWQVGFGGYKELGQLGSDEDDD